MVHIPTGDSPQNLVEVKVQSLRPPVSLLTPDKEEERGRSSERDSTRVDRWRRGRMRGNEGEREKEEIWEGKINTQ